MEKKTVVILSYYFPPYPAIGGLRVRGMAKYLPEYGWDVIVVTPNINIKIHPKGGFRVVQLEKQSIITKLSYSSKHAENKKQIKKKNNIVKHIYNIVSSNDTLSSFLMDIISFIDYVHLRKEFLKTFDRLYKEHQIDAIISTSPPEITHIMASEISRKYRIPWVAEYRDLWTKNPLPKWRNTKLGNIIIRFIETKTLKYASTIVVINEQLRKNEQAIVKDKKIKIIKNGFDPDEIVKTIKQVKVKQVKECNKFTITYTGSFYKSKRNPLPVAHAIDELIGDGMLPKGQIQLNLFGPNLSENISEKLQEFKFINTGILPREKARELQWNSDVLLLLLAEEDYQSIPAKLFEYLSTTKPILAVGPTKNRMIEEILNKTGLGIFVVSTNKDVLKNAIASLYNHEIKIKPKKHVIIHYSQKEMAKKMSQVLNKVLNPTPYRGGEQYGDKNVQK